jgi:hypothetical protein
MCFFSLFLLSGAPHATLTYPYTWVNPSTGGILECANVMFILSGAPVSILGGITSFLPDDKFVSS